MEVKVAEIREKDNGYCMCSHARLTERVERPVWAWVYFSSLPFTRVPGGFLARCNCVTRGVRRRVVELEATARPLLYILYCDAFLNLLT